MNEVSLLDVDRWALAKKVLVIALAGGGVALALEPDHTSGLPILAAFGLWASHILFAAGLFLALCWAFQNAPLRSPLPTVLSVILLPFLFAPISLLLDYGFGNPHAELQTGASLSSLYLAEVLAVAPVGLMVAIVTILALRWEAPRGDGSGQTGSALVLNEVFPDIPRSLGNDIVLVSAQDHYVEVITTNGRALLSEQFGECVEKLAQADGLQCHRSHWICLAHVRKLSRSGSAYSCTMSTGDEVPVSRRRYAELKGRIAGGAGSLSPA